MKQIHLLIILLIFFSCKKEVYPNEVNEKLSVEEVIRRSKIIKNTGSLIVYNQTKDDLKRLGQYEELLPISKLMSDKYNYSKASYDVYQIYKCIYGFELFELNKEKQNIALKYLLNANSSGIKEAKNDLEKYLSEKLFVTKKNNEYKLKS